MFTVGSPYHLYMMEVDRNAKIDAVIKEFKHYAAVGYNINNADLQEKILNEYNLSLDTLTDLERSKIVNAI